LRNETSSAYEEHHHFTKNIVYKRLLL
jgi:hypothetical protein